MVFAIILLAVHAAFEFAVNANLHTPIIYNAQAMGFVIALAIVLIVTLLVNLILSFRLPLDE
jgi:hypothetical protein